VTLNIFHHLEQRVFEIAERSKEGNPEDFDWEVRIPWCAGSQIPPPKLPKERSYKTCAIISDLHRHNRFNRTPNKLVKYLNENYDLVLSLYGKMNEDPTFYERNLEMPYIFFPPWVETEYYYPSNKPKLYDIVMLGNFSSRRVYPFRFNVLKNLKRAASINGWSYLMKPSPKGRSAFRKIDRLYDRGEYVGKRYVETLGRSKIMISGSSVYKYPLLRYFEGMACKTCVVGDKPLMFEECGFADHVDYWMTNNKSWIQDVEMLLEDDILREYIAENGHQTVLRRHTAETRAKEMVRYLEKYR